MKILKDDAACPGASQVIQWIRGCFDAFDKKYVSPFCIKLKIVTQRHRITASLKW